MPRKASALATIPSREPTELSELLVRGNLLLNDTFRQRSHSALILCGISDIPSGAHLVRGMH